MRRAILWLNEHWLVVLLWLGIGIFIAFFGTGIRTNYSTPTAGRDFLVTLVGTEILGLGGYWFVRVAWPQLVRWAESPPQQISPLRETREQWSARTDREMRERFILEDAQREVEAIAPSESE